MKKEKTLYTITLKNGKKLTFWFMGAQFEKLLKDYDIPYVKKENKYVAANKNL